MAKFVSPQLGYNNNVRHRGRVFHVQTEDSGVNHPHIITHLFMDGGRILKSVKKSYAEHVGSDTLKETVKTLMKDQHKAMFIALRDGQFDELFEPKKASSPSVKQVVAPAVPEAPPTKPELPPSSEKLPAAAEAKPASEKQPNSEELGPNTIDESRRPPPVPVEAPTEPFALDAIGPNTVPEAPRPPARISIPPPTLNEPRRPSAAELTLDFDALERDAGPGMGPMFNSNDLPPPPANLFAKERGTGAYSTVNEVEPHHDDVRKPDSRVEPRPITQKQARPSMPPSQSAPRNPSRPPLSTKENGRYAATRPATIFGSTIKPAAPTSSIFGDELVSDKSLDEVILSYLAEDLEPRK